MSVQVPCVLYSEPLVLEGVKGKSLPWQKGVKRSPQRGQRWRFWRLSESSQTLWFRAHYLLYRCDGCEAVLLGIEQQVLRANQYKENHSRTQQQVEAEVRKRTFAPCFRVSLFAPSACSSWCRHLASGVERRMTWSLRLTLSVSFLIPDHRRVSGLAEWRMLSSHSTPAFCSCEVEESNSGWVFKMGERVVVSGWGGGGVQWGRGMQGIKALPLLCFLKLCDRLAVSTLFFKLYT